MTVLELKHRVAELESRLDDLEAQLAYAQALAGIKRGLAEADRRQGTPAREWAKKIRARHKLPR